MKIQKWAGAFKEEQNRFNTYYDQIKQGGSIFFAGRLLERAARLFPNVTALICRSESITYQELYEKSCNVSRYLKENGVKARDRVCLLFDNSIEFYIGYFGIWQTGAVVVPLNTFLHEKELHHILDDAQPAYLIVSDICASQFQENSYSFPPIMTESTLKEVAQESSGGSFEITDLAENEMAALLYTSGTTGFPKGVMLSSKNILVNVIQGASRTQISSEDTILAALPLFHSFAQNLFVWGNIFVGSTAIIVPRIERRLLLEGIEKKPTIVAGVPALYGLFCLMKTVPFDTVRYFVCGGDALPDKIRLGFELIYRRRICNGYGLTEASPMISVNLADDLTQPNTVGRPSIGLSCSLRDEHGNEVAKGQKGILWVKGDNIMLGYFNAPEQTAKVIKDDWLDTGDWAFFDDQDRIVISGRHKDLIIHKGFNIYPQEIENVLMSHANVIFAAVVGQEQEGVGEVPVAFVTLKEKSESIEKELKELCSQHLAAYKVPRQYIVVKEMPTTSLRKIDKKALRKEYLS